MGPHPKQLRAVLPLRHAVGAAAGGVDALLNPTAIQVLDADAYGGQQQNTTPSSLLLPPLLREIRRCLVLTLPSDLLTQNSG
ncbi:MAG: hypothetical protein F4218_04365 [Synechococcus sp. SB0677_bin_5]|nr:hypothetical protein [Synechococcus sp. SB0677_bin_5]